MKKLYKALYTATVFAGIFLLSACNGSSGENTTTPTPVIDAASVSIALYNAQGQAQQSFLANETITLIASVADQNNAAIANKAVSFSADIGELSVESKLTNSSGEAIITLSNTALAAGAGTITVASDLVSSDIDYEFLTTAGQLPSNLATEIRLNGELVNQFRADQQVQIITLFVDQNNQAVANEIITLTADKGLLAATTALTNEQGVATVTLSGNDDLGAGVLIASIAESTSVTPARINYEIIASDSVIIDEEVRIGYFDGDNFIEGQIQLSVSDNTISAGGTLGLTVDLVDASGEPINTSTPVSFTSSCVQNANATIDASVFSIRGTATSTFEDIDCAGANGIDDIIEASVTINGITNTANATIAIEGEALGSIEFISAEPTSIVLKGTGGQGKQETSTLTFLVKSALGNPLAQQAVDFVLDTTAGGIELTPTSGLTNSQGFITTKVNAGTVPTAVRVTAISTMTVDGNEINVQTQSDLLSINTGLPEQSSMTISTSFINPEAFDINNVNVNITAQLADNFNNPVPDGTTVNFTTEGGSIGSSCTTVNGACSVVWTSANPRPSDHRITILATASGHETFFESNGNNFFDDEDGSASVVNAVSSGKDRISPASSGFIDMSEAWRDDDEDDQYDSGERFIDFNNDEAFSQADGLFNGPQCQGALCAPEGANEIHVRKSLIMIMSSSSALYILENATTGTDYENNSTNTSVALPNIADGGSLSLRVIVQDTAQQSMPAGTSINVNASAGTLLGTTSGTVPQTRATSTSLEFIIQNPVDGDPETGVLTVDITSPSGVVTSLPLKTYNLL